VVSFQNIRRSADRTRNIRHQINPHIHFEVLEAAFHAPLQPFADAEWRP